MDINFDTQNLAINKTVFETELEQPIDCDFLLPDYCGDIARILKCSVKPVVDSKQVIGNRISIEGTAEIRLIYCDDKGSVRCFENNWQFARAVDTESIAADCTVEIDADMDYVNCRATSPRKLDVHGGIRLRVRVCCGEQIGLICGSTGGGVQLKYDEMTVRSYVAGGEKTVISDEILEMPEGNSPIEFIIRSDSSAIINEYKVITNKLIIKGELTVSVLYSADSEKNILEQFHTTIPISQIVDVNGVDDDCRCSARIITDSIILKPRADVNGDCRSVSAEIRLRVKTEAYRMVPLRICTDAYSTEYESEISRRRVSLLELAGDFSENILCKKTVDLAVSDVSKVSGMWCDASVQSVRCEGSELVISGTVLAGVMAFDSDSGAAYAERPVDFEYRRHFDDLGGVVVCDPEVTVMGASYAMLGGNTMEMRVELLCVGTVFVCRDKDTVSDVKVDESRRLSGDGTALTVYYADAGERVWDIARSHRAAMSDIMEENNLTDEVISAAKMLLIPSV